MKAFIHSISYYLPKGILDNDALISEFPEWSVEKVTKKIGVNSRHVAAENETAGDMAIKAANKLFEEHKVKNTDIDFILFCTQSPDYHLPTTACIIQDALGIPTSAGALDFNLGCSGYIYGLAIAKGLIAAGVAGNVLLLTAETYTKYAHPKDKGNRSIFGDGASATFVSTKGMAEIGDFALGTDGKGADNLIVMTGSARHPQPLHIDNTDESGALKSPDHLYMNGAEIFNFTLETVPALIEEVLQKNQLEPSQIAYHIFHQANKFMLETLRKVCAISKEKFYIDLTDVGNTVSSTIPIALGRSMQSGKIEKGDIVLIAGFGVGYSWGATILKF